MYPVKPAKDKRVSVQFLGGKNNTSGAQHQRRYFLEHFCWFNNHTLLFIYKGYYIQSEAPYEEGNIDLFCKESVFILSVSFFNILLFPVKVLIEFG